jgi:ABC-type oligopeptide transport system ATPase subunit
MEATIVVKDLRKTFRQSAKQMKINHSKEKIKVAVDGISFETFPGKFLACLVQTAPEKRQRSAASPR